MRNIISTTTRSKNNLLKITDKQYGYFTASQAVKTGYADNNHRRFIDNGNWLKISTGLFRLPGYPDLMESEFTKWSLWSRNQKDQPQGTISHNSALAFFGLGEFIKNEIHLTVPTRFQKLVPGEVIIHKASIHLSDIEAQAGFMITRLPKTFEDLRNFFSAREIWNATVEKAYDAGRISKEEYLQLGFAPKVVLLGAAAGNGAICPPAAETVSGGQGNQAANVTPSGIPKTVDDENKEGLGGSALMRERIYRMIFQRTHAHNRDARRRAQAGFTLVELLVVIGIISILAALLIPVLDKAVEQARQIACMNNFKQQGLAFEMYADANGDHFASVSEAPYYTNLWFHRLSPYTGDNWTIGTLVPLAKSTASVFHCPTFKIPSPHYIGTGMNKYVGGKSGTWFEVCARAPLRSKIPKPGTCILTSESGDFHLEFSAITTFGDLRWDLWRHRGGCNILYADEHVKWLPGELLNASDL